MIASLPRRLPALACLLLLWVGLAGLPGPANGATESTRINSFELTDQFGNTNRVEFPRSRPLLLLIGDRRGSEEVDAWIDPLKQRWGDLADLAGIADVSAAPRFIRGRILEGIRRQRPRPLMLDFEGKVTAPLQCTAKTANLLVVARDGRLLARLTGKPDATKLAAVGAALGSPAAGSNAR